MNPKELLTKVGENLESIAKQRDSYRETCEEKNIEIEKLKVTISDLEERLAHQLEEQPKNQSNSTYTSENNDEVKLKIDGLIEEIDECLALLNN